ncbi:MAG TPA: RNA polymerase sigma-70 factor [Puia sp.]|nr:RNA polymerase sigma-70 factor [Puia sp.]
MTTGKIRDLQQRIGRFDDAFAYRELYTSLYGCLFGFARTIIPSRESAEEVVSDVFIKVWERRREIEKIKNLKLYLYVATRNIAFNYLDKQKRIASHPIDAEPEFTSIYFDPEQLLVTADMLALIQKAIDQLPPRCKIIFKLVKDDSLKYREVAEILNLSVKTVENQMAIALEKIGKSIRFEPGRSIPSTVKS